VGVEDNIILDQMVAEVLAQAGPVEAPTEKTIEVGDDIFTEDPDHLEGKIQPLSRLFSALGHPVRMEIAVFLTRFESRAGDLGYMLEQPKSSVSHHLRILEKAGVVNVARNGNERSYSIKAEHRTFLEAAGRLVKAQ
jgi:DNA-binding transcriptional ArsR family regulator